MSTNGPSLKIEEKDLTQYNRPANSLIANVAWVPQKNFFEEKEKTSIAGYRRSRISENKAEELSLVKIGSDLSGEKIILSDSINHCVNIFQEAIRIGIYVSDAYIKNTNLDNLMSLNKKNKLSSNQSTEMTDKNATCCAIQIFTIASYMVDQLSQYRREEVTTRNMDIAPIPEINFNNQIDARQCLTYFYCAFLSKSGIVKDEIDFIKLSLLYFEKLIQEIKNREEALQYKEPFTSKNYKLENSDFHINGFEVTTGGQISKIEFNKVEQDNIVGNMDSKLKALRLMQRILCYCQERKMNPMKVLGGLPILRSGFGKPGTGKGLHIASVATLLAERCEELTGMPFLYHPMPMNLVSTFQGGSAERALDWLKVFQNPNIICYGPIDDAEQNFQDRTRQGVSAGVIEVISTFLPFIEGPNAIWHGNAVLEIFTNLPEIIDPAVLSRIQEKFEINGAETYEDCMDQDHIWWRNFQNLSEEFFDMEDPEDYTYMSAQQVIKSMSDYSGLKNEPENPVLIDIYDEVFAMGHNIKQHAFYGRLFPLVMKRFPKFSSRDIRNIQNAIDERRLDFDFPDEWMENPEIFYRQDYERKMDMIKDAMVQNMRGLTFSEIKNQETIRYLETMAQIAEVGEKRAIKEAADRYYIDGKARQEAQVRLK